MPVTSVVIPDDREFNLVDWKIKHGDHFVSNEHVSKSKFAAFFGSVDRGCKLHIPAMGEARDRMHMVEEKAAQKIRCSILRNERSAEAS